MRRDIEQALESYRVLGLEAGAPAREVRRAYLHLMKHWHPDLRPGASSEEKARRINRAFEILTAFDPERLRQIRRPRRPSPSSSPKRPRRRRARRWRPEPQSTERGKGLYRNGRDIAGRIAVSRQEASHGAHWKLSLPTCPSCAGWGAAPGHAFQPCRTCHQLGFDPSQAVSTPTSCGDCGGRGSHFVRSCGRCRGTGAVTLYEVRLALPPQTATDWWTVRGLGHPGLGGAPPGDLYIRVEVGRL